jgi:hypothetical protein
VIGKTTKGNGFGGVLRYVFEKPEAKYIGGNMMGRTPSELALEFRAIAKRSKKVKIPVAHISFSPSPQEHLDDLQALEFAQAYMDKIGFGDCQWVLAGHNDTKTPEGKERPHFHIIANRVRITDGRVVTAWRDWRRSELALRELEQEFNLVRVQPSWEIYKSAASRGQTQRVKKELHEFEEGKRDKPPDFPVKVQLQNTIDQAAIDHPTLTQLIERLQDARVEVKVGYTRTGKIKGISYKQDEITFSGTQLGRAYTFPGLIKHRGVSYDSKRDDDAIQIRLSRVVQSPAQANPEQDLTQSYTSFDDKKYTDESNRSKQLSPEKSAQEDENTTLQREQERIQLIADVIADYLAQKRVQRLQGKNYTAYWNSNELALLKNGDTDNPLEILRVKYQNNLWEPVGTPQVSEAHVKDFQEMRLTIQKERIHIIAPVITKLLESQDNRDKNRQFDLTNSTVRRLEGKNYILLEDKTQNQISLLAKDGRGKLIQINADSGVSGNLNLKAEDVHNFEHIAKMLVQQRGNSQKGLE